MLPAIDPANKPRIFTAHQFNLLSYNFTLVLLNNGYQDM